MAATDEHGGGGVNVFGINPHRESTYALIAGLLDGLVDVFPDRFLHLGGDEVNFECWQEDTEVAKWMVDRGFGGDAGGWNTQQKKAQVLAYFTSRVALLAAARHRTAVLWQVIVLLFNYYKSRPHRRAVADSLFSSAPAPAILLL